MRGRVVWVTRGMWLRGLTVPIKSPGPAVSCLLSQGININVSVTTV